jgi:hypothetical protein
LFKETRQIVTTRSPKQDDISIHLQVPLPTHVFITIKALAGGAFFPLVINYMLEQFLGIDVECGTKILDY